MILPNLEEIIAWFKARIVPEDKTQGAGISDWTITAEYVPNLVTNGVRAYGAVCSPSDHEAMLTPEDVAAKRAHFLICTPETENDIREMYETFRHECEHILQSMYAILGEGTRAAMENHAHSMGNFVAKLTPQEVSLFPRIKPTPMARAYRAKEETMPDMEENKDKPDKASPAMQEGAPRDAAAINADIANADPNDAALLVKLAAELRQALIAKAVAPMGGNGSASEPAPVPVPTMGMKPEDAYARGKREAEAAGEKKLVERFANTLKGSFTDEQLAMVRRMPSLDDAEALVKTYPRAANQNDQAKLGMLSNPKIGSEAKTPLTGGLGANESTAMARKMGAQDKRVIPPHVQKNGRFSMGTMTPSQLRAQIAAGKDPRNQFPSTMGAE